MAHIMAIGSLHTIMLLGAFGYTRCRRVARVEVKPACIILCSCCKGLALTSCLARKWCAIQAGFIMTPGSAPVIARNMSALTPVWSQAAETIRLHTMFQLETSPGQPLRSVLHYHVLA